MTMVKMIDEDNDGRVQKKNQNVQLFPKGNTAMYDSKVKVDF